MIDKQKVITVLSIGSFLLFGTLSILIILSIIIGNTINDNRLAASLIATSISLLAIFMSKTRHTLLASSLLVLMTFAAGAISLGLWSINTPFGLLLIVLSIILSAVMIGVRVSVITSLLGSLTIFLILLLNQWSIIKSDFNSLAVEATLGDAIGYAVVLTIISVVSWFAGSNIEKSYLYLKKSKENIEKELRTERRKLRKANQREVDQLFKFAQLGQHSSLVLHDLANQLAVLNFTNNDSAAMQIAEAQVTIKDVEKLIDRAYSQLSDMTKSAIKIEEIVKMIHSRYSSQATIRKRVANNVAKPMHIIANLDQLSMITDVLFKNAVEALNSTMRRNRSLVIEIRSDPSNLYISFMDNSGTLDKIKLESIFEPKRSSKEKGHGIGLVVAKHVVNYHLGGDLTCKLARPYTVFTVSIPIESIL